MCLILQALRCMNDRQELKEAAADRIERVIDIAADAETVWELIRTPGWWVNDGVVVEHQHEAEAGATTIVRDPVHGAFPVLTVAHEPPRRAVYRWPVEADASPSDPRTSTKISMIIEDRPDGVRLTVIECGFAGLELPLDQRRAVMSDHSGGWDIEVWAARARCDRGILERVVVVPLTAERTWDHVATPDGLARWYAFDGAVIEPRLGGEVALSWADHGTFRGEVLAWEPGRRLVYRIALEPEAAPAPGIAAEVTIAVRSAAGGGTVVAVHETFDGVHERFGTPEELVAAEDEGWKNGLAELRRLTGATSAS